MRLLAVAAMSFGMSLPSQAVTSGNSKESGTSSDSVMRSGNSIAPGAVAVKFANQKKPDLAPYTPSGWSSSMVIATSSTSRSNTSTSFNNPSALYLNFAFTCRNAPITRKFYCALYVDGKYRHRWESSSSRIAKDSYEYETGYKLEDLSDGSHTIKVVADVYDVVAESSESNNTITKTIRVSRPKPDLEPYTPSGWSSSMVIATSSSSRSNTSTSFNNPSALYLNWAFACRNASINKRMYYALYVDGKYRDRWSADNCDKDDYNYVTGYRLEDLSDGSHTIKVVADVYGAVAETSESNNTITKTIRVTRQKPNLAFDYTPSGWGSPLVVATSSGSRYGASTYYDNQTLYLNWALDCSYGDAAKKFYTALYIDNKYRTRWETSSLGKDRYTTVTGYSIGRLSPGYHTIKLVSDVYGAVAETSESDNTAQTTIYVNASSHPDLSFTYTPDDWSSPLVVATSSSSTYNTSTTFTGSQTLYVNWAVACFNGDASQKFYTALYIDGKYKTRWDTGSLAEDHYTYVSGYSIGRLSGGYHTIKLVTDVYGAISETNEGNNTIELRIYVSGAGSNDSFANAATISGSSGSATGSNATATAQSGEPFEGKVHTVWWRWTAPSSGTVTFRTEGSSFDTVMGVFKGSSVSSLTQVCYDDDGGPSSTSVCSFYASQGTTYYICVAGYSSAYSGSISLSWRY